MKCPNCSLENPPLVLRCDCGFNFDKGWVESEHAHSQVDEHLPISTTVRLVGLICLFSLAAVWIISLSLPFISLVRSLGGQPSSVFETLWDGLQFGVIAVALAMGTVGMIVGYVNCGIQLRARRTAWIGAKLAATFFSGGNICASILSSVYGIPLITGFVAWGAFTITLMVGSEMVKGRNKVWTIGIWGLKIILWGATAIGGMLILISVGYIITWPFVIALGAIGGPLVASLQTNITRKGYGRIPTIVIPMLAAGFGISLGFWSRIKYPETLSWLNFFYNAGYPARLLHQLNSPLSWAANRPAAGALRRLLSPIAFPSPLV